ncbi:MAG: NUDIX domain-containing protein [Promethearchaeota archaeon]
MKSFFVGLVGIIEKDERFLILKRSPTKDFEPNHWEVVTGRFEEEETPDAGILREIEEETTLKAEVIMPVTTSFFYRGGKEFPMVSIAFWCKYIKGKVKLDWEHTEYKWVGLDEVLGEPTLSHFHEIFRKIKKLKKHLPEQFSL